MGVNRTYKVVGIEMDKDKVRYKLDGTGIYELDTLFLFFIPSDDPKWSIGQGLGMLLS